MSKNEIMPLLQDKRVAAVEFHDSRLSQLSFQAGGKGTFAFEHIDVFLEVSANNYDVWSYRAELLLERVRSFCMDKPLDSSDHVSDGRIIDVDGREIELLSALDWVRADVVELVLFLGGKILVRASNARLILQTPIEKLEQWIGPLRTEN